MASEYILKKGPNRVKPSNTYVTDDRKVAVRLRIGREGHAAREPLSVPTLVQRTARDYPDQPALVFKNHKGAYETVTYRYK